MAMVAVPPDLPLVEGLVVVPPPPQAVRDIAASATALAATFERLEIVTSSSLVRGGTEPLAFGSLP